MLVDETIFVLYGREFLLGYQLIVQFKYTLPNGAIIAFVNVNKLYNSHITVDNASKRPLHTVHNI